MAGVAVDEGKLVAVLTDLARTLATESPAQTILDHLVDGIIEVLPLRAAGVTLITAGRAPRYVTSSDRPGSDVERWQAEIGDGPWLTAYETCAAVAVPDLGSEQRWPEFASEAVSAGLKAAFTFPLLRGTGSLGALTLYRDERGSLSPEDMSAAQTLADVAAAYLINVETLEVARMTIDNFRHSAQHDALTGLPNRRLLHERLEHAAERARRMGNRTAVLFIDLDRFKNVNDTYGHVIGDELLLAVAERLKELVRPGDTVARLSGDEFVLLCEGLLSTDNAVALAQRVDEAFSRPFDMRQGAQITLSASTGLAFSEISQDAGEQLLADADHAMYEAKRKGGGRHQLMDPSTAFKAHESIGLERDLHEAFVRRQLEVHYQPIVRTADGLVTGVEALLRWNHPERGPVPALTMVSIAEQSGLIAEIGGWVLHHACADRVRWRGEHPEAELGLAVNISARQIMRPDFSDTVRRVLDLTGMDPAELVLEMTENIFIEDSEHSMVTMAELKRLGVRLALDDFGTGYSSLSYLRRLPIDIVKIDQSFIHDIDHASTDGSIVEAVTILAHALGLAVTAEGVETRAQRDRIQTIGCDLAQGFYYSRAVSAEAISEHLQRPRSLQ